MSEYLQIIVSRVSDALEGYSLVECSDNSALFASEEAAFRVEHNQAGKTLDLYRGVDKDNLIKTQSYLFDPAGGDGVKEAESAASDFVEAIAFKPKPINRQFSRSKDSSSDESTALFFVNRIPGVLPECREPLIAHKAHYDTLLPEQFCSEVVTVAVANMLRDSRKSEKCKKFFELLTTMYQNGNLDTRGIIIQTILNSITNEQDIKFVEELLGEDVRRAWGSGRRLIGKKLKPEKDTHIKKMAAFSAEALNGQR